MWKYGAMAAVLLLTGCAAGGHGAKREINAVVQDETARQAAVREVQAGGDSKDALKAAADATDRSKNEAKPPS